MCISLNRAGFEPWVKSLDVLSGSDQRQREKLPSLAEQRSLEPELLGLPVPGCHRDEALCVVGFSVITVPYCLLLTAHCLLLTAHCSLLTAHSPAIEQSLKTAPLAGLPPPLRYGAP
jgi:hypothetical protein